MKPDKKYKNQYVDMNHPLFGPVMVYTNIEVNTDVEYYAKVEVVATEEEVLIVKFKSGAYHESLMPVYDQIADTDDIRYAWLVLDENTEKWNVCRIAFRLD